MKSVLSYLLLIVYSTLLIKPVLPFFLDIAQHIFTYKEHITTVHFENGAYHVHNELKANSKKESPNGEAPIEKKSISQTEHIFYETVKTTPVVDCLQLQYSKLSYYLVSTQLPNDYPPPKV